jgi:hypothetical protein
MTDELKRINTRPSKSFFIKTLVRDIDLIDAILDLIDNSIDNHIRNNYPDRRRILIEFSKEKFTISDNCGGIKKEQIYDRVLKFGQPSSERFKTIGVYGIGMKRAIFKMGENILLESDDGVDNFSIRITKAWLDNDNAWDLDFESEGSTTGIPSFKITISEIFSNISEEFGSTPFVNDLIKRIKDTYSIFIEDKVDILVNGEDITHFDFGFLFDLDKKFRPFHKKYLLEDVHIEIFAGFTSPNGEIDKAYGWYVFCNDRLVLRNDVSDRTGWGGFGAKKYHYPEDDRFLGLVFFSSDNPIKLPWQTAKENIQYDSKIYRQAQLDMRAITTRHVNVIRLAGRTPDPDTGVTIGKNLFKGVSTKPRKEIIDESIEILPNIKGVTISTLSEYTTITYSKKRNIVQKMKQQLGDVYMTNKKLGEETFRYVQKMKGLNDE